MLISFRSPLPAFVAAVGVFTVGACADKPVPTAPKPLNIVALDRSGSTEAFRGDQKNFVGEAIGNARDRGSMLAIWVVDRTATCQFDPKPLYDSKELKNEIFAALDTPTDKNATRTRPLMLWEQMADKYGANAATPEQAVAIVYLTDGGNDWAGEDAKIPSVLAKLAANPLVRVAVVGVNPELKPPLEKQFAVFGDRAVVWGRDATTSQVATWRKGNQ